MSALAACVLGCASGAESEAGSDVPGAADLGPDAGFDSASAETDAGDGAGPSSPPDAGAGADSPADAAPTADPCSDEPCFAGVACSADPKAPGGYVCGACPAGYSGDGVDCAPLCQDAGALQCPGAVAAASNGAGSADQVDTWACSSVPLTGSEIVYRFVPDHSGTAAASLSDLSADLDLVVVAESAGVCNAADASVCAAESHAAGTASELVTWEAVAGTAYYVVVDGYQGAASSFTLRVGTAVTSLQLSEVALGGVDFIEIASHSACPVDLEGLAVVHDPSLDAAFEYLLPADSTVEPGGVLRLVETTADSFSANEIDLGVEILDDPIGVGFTALCNGRCLDDCSNLLDYVERDDDAADGIAPGAPSCARFSPAPLDASAPGGSALVRVDRQGSRGDWRASDWAFGTASRD